jgi:hypothetical protein
MISLDWRKLPVPGHKDVSVELWNNGEIPSFSMQIKAATLGTLIKK